MSSIEIPGRHESQPASGGRTSREGFQQSRWLKALEDAGLHSALRVAEPYRSEPTATARPPSDTADGNSVATMARRQTAEANATAGAECSGSVARPPAAPAAIDAAVMQRPRPGCTEAHAETLAASCLPEAPALAEDAQEIGSGARTADPTGKRTWQSTSVVVLPSNQGIEVWVRDARMTTPELAAFLAGLRKSAADAGTGLARVALNGKSVYSLSEHERNQSESKEG